MLIEQFKLKGTVHTKVVRKDGRIEEETHYNTIIVKLKEHLSDCLYTTSLDSTGAMGANGFIAAPGTLSGKDGILLQDGSNVDLVNGTNFSAYACSYHATGNYYKTFKAEGTASASISIEKAIMGVDVNTTLTPSAFNTGYAVDTTISKLLDANDTITITWKIEIT